MFEGVRCRDTVIIPLPDGGREAVGAGMRWRSIAGEMPRGLSLIFNTRGYGSFKFNFGSQVLFGWCSSVIFLFYWYL